ncbi:MAG: 4-alpha-glucanotransferase [Thiohalocapsa sp.]|jgi:4-alpha-glucanotransferase|uniref:4-alpha-glucanotransferase n=1 Tax=Thiohalocapsa sp. TaxID=2497641 RepID=UPI0025CFB073|nr:4-alpha-glucanotransferase [Thiohalocapsa sp.]MCG6943279.1 4-alpha-glucanotransferase [Thiohalocapsa sp.]
MHRTSGILLHPTSLPAPDGAGDLGPAAYRFVDFLAAAGQGLWQMLPLGPTGYQDSPYQCTSAFAGNPLLVSLDLLREDGWLDAADTAPDRSATFPRERVDFAAVHAHKRRLLLRAFRRFETHADADARNEYNQFCLEHAAWLDDYALYAAIKLAQHDRPWIDWPQPLALRDADALADWHAANHRAVEFERFCQFLFFRQWHALRARAHARGIRLIGDIPIFVAHDSAEVWTHRNWFRLDASGRPTVIAGVPPDYFSATGQRWGNPLYRWDALAADGYAFWVRRLRLALELLDCVRIDHFRGFAGYWEVPADEPTAINGRWVPGPGMALFRALRDALGDTLPLIAEDLGVITEDVIALRDALELPGMAILQMAFEDASAGFGEVSFLPHNHHRRLVVYTGTHDNDTLLGWWSGLAPPLRDTALRYLRSDGREIHWDFIATALASVADLALLPLQDLLGLGTEARMNRPGSAGGNWQWRCTEAQLDGADAARLADLSALYGRRPHPD